MEPMPAPTRDLATFPRRVVWARGPGCAELAESLATETAFQVVDDPSRTCIAHRADLAVMSSLGSFDLVPLAVPSDIDLPAVTSIRAAISSGPHSDLAALIAVRLATSLDVPARALTAVRPGSPRAESRRRLTELEAGTGLEGEVVEVAAAGDLMSGLGEGVLLVLGAPGGSWLTRQFLGPGAKLRSKAPAGVVVVRDSPARAFQHLAEVFPVGIHTRVADALQLTISPTLPVTEDGRLVGIARRSTLEQMEPDEEIGGVLEDPPYVVTDDELASLGELADFYEHGPIPVVDRRGILVGVLPADTVG